MTGSRPPSLGISIMVTHIKMKTHRRTALLRREFKLRQRWGSPTSAKVEEEEVEVVDTGKKATKNSAKMTVTSRGHGWRGWRSGCVQSDMGPSGGGNDSQGGKWLRSAKCLLHLATMRSLFSGKVIAMAAAREKSE